MADELRSQIRDEPAPDDAVVVVRGGPATLDKLRSQALRTRRAYLLDGKPLFGVSVFCAVDSDGPGSLDGLLSGRMVSYRVVHLPVVATLVAAGFALLPSFGRPHFTLKLVTGEKAELERLLAALGPSERNPYYVSRRRRGGAKP